MTNIALPNPFAEMSAAWRAVAQIVAVEPELAPEISEILERAVAASLKGQLNERHVAWAKGHDWFVADLGNGLIQIVDRWVNVRTGERGEDFIVWDRSFYELRDWAGY